MDNFHSFKLTPGKCTLFSLSVTDCNVHRIRKEGNDSNCQGDIRKNTSVKIQSSEHASHVLPKE